MPDWLIAVMMIVLGLIGVYFTMAFLFFAGFATLVSKMFK
jgi:hypothetical protein